MDTAATQGYRPVDVAWEQALYGDAGFFVREAPADHFRTSVTASRLYAEAVAELALACDVDTVWDVGAGRGELLAGLAALNPGWALRGVELAPRPRGLDPAIGWHTLVPERIEGLIVANELLDDVPCPVAEVDDAGEPRLLEVDPATGDLRAGASLSPADADWVGRWWPDARPGERIEVGRTRDEAWADVVSCLGVGLAVCVDYGHVRDDRPPGGTLRSYRGGRLAEPVWDGSADLTADVALDAVAAAVDGRLIRQREALRALGVDGQRPDLALATADPPRYLRLLARAGEAAELTSVPGIGAFGWVVCGIGVADPFADRTDDPPDQRG